MRKITALLTFLPLLLCGEDTFSMVKPEAVEQGHACEIIEMYKQNGLTIVETKEVQLSKEQAESFYAVHKDRPFYNDLTTYIASGPVVAIHLSGDNAVARVREIMGATNPANAAPGTIRACFGASLTQNAVHGSDSVDNAKQEIEFFFKN